MSYFSVEEIGQMLSLKSFLREIQHNKFSNFEQKLQSQWLT